VEMKIDLGFTWKNADMNVTGFIRKYGVHAARVVRTFET
jgi:hypothetical protein